MWNDYQDDRWENDLVGVICIFAIEGFLKDRGKISSIWFIFQIIIALPIYFRFMIDFHIYLIISYLFHLIKYFLSSSLLLHSSSIFSISYFNFLLIFISNNLMSRSSPRYYHKWIIEMMLCIFESWENSIWYDNEDNFFMIRIGVSMKINLWVWGLMNLYLESKWLNLRMTRSLILNSSFIYHLS